MGDVHLVMYRRSPVDKGPYSEHVALPVQYLYYLSHNEGNTGAVAGHDIINIVEIPASHKCGSRCTTLVPSGRARRKTPRNVRNSRLTDEPDNT